MQLNMSKFKKLSEDKKSATFKHPDGHKIMVAKHVLSPGMRNEISKMPLHLEEGTPDKPVQSEDDNSDQNASYDPSVGKGAQAPVTINIGGGASGSWDQQQSPQASTAQEAGNRIGEAFRQGVQYAGQALGTVAKPVVEGTRGFIHGINGEPAAPEQAPTAPEVPDISKPSDAQIVPAVQAQTIPAIAPSQPQAPSAYQQYQQGIGQEKQGLQQEAQHMGQQGQEEAKIQNEAAAQAQALQQDTNEKLAKNTADRAELQKHYANGDIDPMHLFHTMGTGQKIMTAIGLLLGGIGSGFNNGVNPAMDYVNKLIDRDIESQKESKGRLKTLLEANQQDYNNIDHAAQMTRIQQQDAVSYKLKEVAAKLSDPLAKDRAMKAAGSIDADSAQKSQQLAAQAAMMGNLGGGSGIQQAGMSSGPVDPSIPSRKILQYSVSGLMPDSDKKEAIKELNTVQQMMKARDDAFETFNKLNQINTIGNRALHLGFTPASVEAIRDNAAVGLARDEAGRVNEFEFKAAKQAFPAPGDTPQTILDKKRNLANIANKKIVAPTLDQCKIPYQNIGRYDQNGVDQFARKK